MNTKHNFQFVQRLSNEICVLILRFRHNNSCNRSNQHSANVRHSDFILNHFRAHRYHHSTVHANTFIRFVIYFLLKKNYSNQFTFFAGNWLFVQSCVVRDRLTLFKTKTCFRFRICWYYNRNKSTHRPNHLIHHKLFASNHLPSSNFPRNYHQNFLPTKHKPILFEMLLLSKSHKITSIYCSLCFIYLRTATKKNRLVSECMFLFNWFCGWNDWLTWEFRDDFDISVKHFYESIPFQRQAKQYVNVIKWCWGYVRGNDAAIIWLRLMEFVTEFSPMKWPLFGIIRKIRRILREIFQ